MIAVARLRKPSVKYGEEETWLAMAHYISAVQYTMRLDKTAGIKLRFAYWPLQTFSLFSSCFYIRQTGQDARHETSKSYLAPTSTRQMCSIQSTRNGKFGRSQTVQASAWHF